MVTPVYIKMIKKTDNTIYYHIEAPVEKQDFYIAINTTQKKLSFLRNQSLESTIKTIMLDADDLEFSDVSGINSAVANFVVSRFFKALRKNELLENMSYNLH